MNITEDIKRLCDICYEIGYIGAMCDKDFADEWADGITNYITELFLAKREQNSITIPTNPYPYNPPYHYKVNSTTGDIDEREAL